MTGDKLPGQLFSRLKPVLCFQGFHILGATVWNVSGVILLSLGYRSPGPTASLFMAGILLVAGGVMVFGARRQIIIYMAASCLAGIGGFLAIYQAFNLDPILWPSEFWRYAGAALNSVGFIAAIAGIWVSVKYWLRKY